jgi:hypothetical protein
MSTEKDISYLGKDFSQFRKNLIDFTKQYFPNNYTDFNESSPGSLFLEMSAYVGDVLSYYADTNLKESLLTQAQESANIYDIANTLGYKPNNSVPAYVKLDIFQLVPSIGTGVNVKPDFTYALTVKSGLQVKGQNSIFRTLDNVDFSFSSSANPTDVTIYETDDTTKQPIYYLLKKQTQAVSGTVKTATFTFNEAVAYDKILLPDPNVIEIVSITESDGDAWTEVPYLAQDTVFQEVPNIAENDPDLVNYRSSSPSLLKLKKTAKRFITKVRSDKKIEIQFGAGVSSNNDEEVIPNPDNVGNGLSGFRRAVNVDIDPSNFLYTRTYGQAPANTTLTVTYTVGNGLRDNVESGILTNIENIQFDDNVNQSLNTGLLNFIKTTVAVNNETPAAGAKSADTLQDIKNNALGNFATQNRLVTRDDYIIRAYSMPARFGSVSKAYIVPDDQITQKDLVESRISNPLAMNMYVLGLNSSGQLTQLNDAIKENLKTYLNYYRILTDAINIKDAFIINIGVDFEISVLSNYNSNEVLLKCIDELKKYFHISRWQINQPIIKSEITNIIGNVRGVQNIVSVQINNLVDTDSGYSGNSYDLVSATRKGIIYPSLDPSIFEVKYPNDNLRGRVVNY